MILNKSLNKEFLIFCLIGLLGFFFDYELFIFFFTFLDQYIYFAKFISTLIAITLTFFLNRFFTFKLQSQKLKYKKHKEYTLYLLVQVIGGFVNFISFSTLIYFYPELLTIPIIPTAISAIFVAFLSFLNLKLFIYKNT